MKVTVKVTQEIRLGHCEPRLAQDQRRLIAGKEVAEGAGGRRGNLSPWKSHYLLLFSEMVTLDSSKG